MDIDNNTYNINNNNINSILVEDIKSCKVINIQQILFDSNEENVLNYLSSLLDAKGWLIIIFHYYNLNNENMLNKISEKLIEFMNNNSIISSLNSTYNESNKKEIIKNRTSELIQVLDIISLLFSFMSQKTIEKSDYDNYLISSTKLINSSEKIDLTNSLTLIAKGFLFYAKGEYNNSEMTFKSAFDKELANKNTNIMVLSTLGLGLNSFVKAKYSDACEYFIKLIKVYSYITESTLECLGICYYNLGKETKSFKMFKKVLEINNKNYKAFCYLAIMEMNKAIYSVSAFEKSSNMFLNSFEMLLKSNDIYYCNSFHLILNSIINYFIYVDNNKAINSIKNRLSVILESNIFKNSVIENKSNKTVNFNNVVFSNNLKDIDKLKSMVYCIFGKTLHYNCQHVEAIINYNKSIQFNNKSEAHFSLGQLYFYNNSYKESLNCFKEAAKYFIDSNSQFEIKKYKTIIMARSYLKLKIDEKTNLNSINYDIDNIDDIINSFKYLIEIKENDLDCIIELAQVYELKNPIKALEYYNNCLFIVDNNKYFSSIYNIEDTHPIIINNIASLKLNIKKTDNTLNLLNRAMDMVKDKTRHYSDKIKLCNQQQTNKGIEFKKEYILENLNKWKAIELSILYNLGICNEYLNNYGDAYNIYKTIILLNPYFVNAYSKLGILSYYRGNIKKALNYLNTAIEKHYDEKKLSSIIQKQCKVDLNDKINKNNKVPSFPYSSSYLHKYMSKPLNPLIIKCFIEWKDISPQEALKTLAQLAAIESKDSYCLVLIGNLNYDLAVLSRSGLHGKITEYQKRIGKATQFYYAALDINPKNYYAAMGLANCISEIQSENNPVVLEVYKSISENIKSGNLGYMFSQTINESILYMNEGKFNKAIPIMQKVLHKLKENLGSDYMFFYNSDIYDIELLLCKALIENKDYDDAIFILKQKIFMKPDNLILRFNYAIVLKKKAENITNSKIILKSNLVQSAKSNLEQALNIFESINKLRKDHSIYSNVKFNFII